MKSKHERRAKWMLEFEAALTAIDPSVIGRINWDAATFHFNQGTSPGLAAVKFSQTEAPAGSKFPAGAVVRRT